MKQNVTKCHSKYVKELGTPSNIESYVLSTTLKAKLLRLFLSQLAEDRFEVHESAQDNELAH